MSAEIFKKWFHEYYVPNVENFLDDRKAGLSSDNAPCHLDEEQPMSREITAYSLPPNMNLLI